MKKILLLPLIALFAMACTTSQDDILTEENTLSSIKANNDAGGCFGSLAARADINVSNGINNGLINFIAILPAQDISGGYKVKVEIEELSDCEDLGSGTGNVRTFTDGYTYYSVGKYLPAVKGVSPLDTFGCYRWRMVFEGVAQGSREIICVTASPWYDAPLF